MSDRRPYGSGTLYVRVDGRGRETWYARTRIDGQRVQRALGPKRPPGSRTGLTKPQAEAALRSLIATAQPSKAPGDRMTIAEAAGEYVTAAERRGRKPNTIRIIRSELRNHIEPFFTGLSMAAVERRDVIEFVSVLEQKGLAPKTIRNVVSTLSALYTFAMHADRRWATTNPCADVSLPAVPERAEIRFLTVEEVRTLVEHVPAGGMRAVDRAMILTAAMAGLRKGELLGLRWEDVDLPARRIRVRRTFTRGAMATPKSRRGTRSVPLSDELATVLQELHETSRWQAPGDLVFAHPVTGTVQSDSKISARFHAALAAAGLPRRRFHDLRHTFGTAMAGAGVPLRSLQAWLGHADFQTTAIYSDYAPAEHEADLVARAFSSDRSSDRFESTEHA